MRDPSNRWRLLPFLIGTLLPFITHTESNAQGQTRSIHVTAVGRDNRPITDLELSDFGVKVNGRTAAVLGVRHAESPLKVAVIVSDAGTGVFQEAVQRFAERLVPHAEVALIRADLGAHRLLAYSSDPVAVVAASRRLGPRGGRGATLVDIIDAVGHEEHPKGTRRAIVVVSTGDENDSGFRPDVVRRHLRESGAALYVLSALGEQLTTPSGVGAAMLPTSAGLLDLNLVLEDGARESGGWHERIVFSDTMIPALDRLVGELLNQYLVELSVPFDSGPEAKLSILAKRGGIKLRAALRLNP